MTDMQFLILVLLLMVIIGLGAFIAILMDSVFDETKKTKKKLE